MATLAEIVDQLYRQRTQEEQSKVFVRGGLLGYQTPSLGGMLTGGLNGNKAQVDWHDEMQKLLLQARQNGDWSLNYQRKF